MRLVALRALLPTAYQTTLLSARAVCSARRMTFELKAPASPLSEVIKIKPLGAPTRPGLRNG